MGAGNQFYEFHHSTFWFEDGIICSKVEPGLIITIDIAKEMVADRMRVFGTRHYPMLSDINDLLYSDPESLKYFAGKEATMYISAGAIYTKDPLYRVMTNAFIFLDKPIVPSKSFSDWNKAKDWLKRFMVHSN